MFGVIWKIWKGAYIKQQVKTYNFIGSNQRGMAGAGAGANHGVQKFKGLVPGEKYQFVVNVWSDLENSGGSMYQTTGKSN